MKNVFEAKFNEIVMRDVAVISCKEKIYPDSLPTGVFWYGIAKSPWHGYKKNLITNKDVFNDYDYTIISTFPLEHLYHLDMDGSWVVIDSKEYKKKPTKTGISFEQYLEKHPVLRI